MGVVASVAVTVIVAALFEVALLIVGDADVFGGRLLCFLVEAAVVVATNPYDRSGFAAAAAARGGGYCLGCYHYFDTNFPFLEIVVVLLDSIDGHYHCRLSLRFPDIDPT